MNREGKKTMATDLRHRICFQSKSSVSDLQGGFVDTWVDSGEPVWAGIFPMRAEKVAEYRSNNVHATHFVKVRGSVVVDELNRIRFGSRYFEILTCENMQERNVEIIITCNEVRA